MADRAAARIEQLLSKMTTAEKAALMTGRDMWSVNPVDRLGIPALKVTDGPNGARGTGLLGTGTPALCLPCGSALGATWNPALVEALGRALAEETRARGFHVLLAPTVNIHRSPLGGRNFECYSEDPHLTGSIAVGFITGVQAGGVGTTIKHFVANDSEFERNTIDSVVPERALREVYLRPFEMAVTEAGAWGLMAAYNRVNGAYACENADMLRGVLVDEWGFDGVVVSDWFGTRSTVASANAGLHLEMPGRGRFYGSDLVSAVEDGDVDEAVLDDSNPLGKEGGENHQQEGGFTAFGADMCTQPCQLGWSAADIQVSARTEMLDSTPFLRDLFPLIKPSILDISFLQVDQTDGDGSQQHVVDLATGWMADNADTVDSWIAEAAG